MTKPKQADESYKYLFGELDTKLFWFNNEKNDDNLLKLILD